MNKTKIKMAIFNILIIGSVIVSLTSGFRIIE